MTMSVSGPDVGFTDFTGLGKGHRGYAHTLTSLFNKCDFGTVETHRHTISFKEASKRLRKQMTESFEYIESQTGRMVKEFNIGKTHVYSQYAVDFNPSQPTTWHTYGGLPVSWENYKKEGFDGMIALGCVIKDIIPKVIRETNKAFEMNSHSYAAGLAQSLVQYYLLQNPDDRLRSVTVEDLGNKSGKDELGSPASVIYVAYKLEPKTTNAFQEFEMKVEPDGSLLTTGIYCDGYFIDCDVHQSLIGSYRLFRKTGKGDIPISKCMKLESMNEFENLVIASSYLKNEQGCSSILNEKSFLQAVDKSQDLLCRLMLSYFGYSEKNVLYLAKALRFAIEKKHDTISMGIAWHLTWIYYKQNQSAFPSLVDIWPAVRCSCTNESEYKNDICSSEAVIVVQLDTDAAQPSVMFFSIKVIYFTNLMDETLPFANRIIPYSDHIPITGSSAEMLFDSHRNLTLICKSSCLTSKEPCRPSNTQFEITACVKLYCKAKGFIPIGEEHFPKIFCGMRTTVVQGTPTLMTGMQIGKKVGTDNFKKGTLGGFVRFRGENAFLTCLHVFLTAEELTADYITLDDTESYHVKYYQNTTEASNKDDGIVCGKIQVFGFGKNSEGTSIDAALIQLEKGIPIDSSHFTATTGLQSCYLNDICIDYNSLRHGFPGPTISIVSIGAVSGNSQIDFNVMVQKPVDIDIDAFKKSINDIILEGMRDHVVAVMQALHSWSDIRTPVRDRIRISVNKICSAEMLAETKESIAEIVCRIFPETLNHENCDQIEKIDKLLHEATFEQTSSRFSAIVSDVHMQTTVLKRTVESAKRMSYKIYKQIYIPGIPFEMGDSGTCLYVHDSVNPNTKGCIGMAIAKHPDGGCIATPIMEILKHFQIRFKDCY